MKAMQRLVGICVLALLAPPSWAQTARSGGGGGASPQLQQQLQQATAERASLQAENSKLKQDLEQANKELGKLRAERGGVEQRAKLAAAKAAQLSGASEATATALERSKGQLQELIGKYRENAQGLATMEADRNKVRADLARRDQELSVCVDRNVGLYELNGEILARLEDRSFFSKVSEREPFTRLARTRLENLIDDYRARADGQHAKKQPPKS